MQMFEHSLDPAPIEPDESGLGLGRINARHAGLILAFKANLVSIFDKICQAGYEDEEGFHYEGQKRQM